VSRQGLLNHQPPASEMSCRAAVIARREGNALDSSLQTVWMAF
jgi:hypothetical protein